MPEEQTTVLAEEIRWGISPEWLARNGRSAEGILKEYLCASCAKKLLEKKTPPTLKTVQSSIQSCCSNDPNFFSEKLPVAESVFRVFLRNGNKPLTAHEISAELGKLRPGGIYRTLPETLYYVLKNDRFYGLQEMG
jgi:hypothetical protein